MKQGVAGALDQIDSGKIAADEDAIARKRPQRRDDPLFGGQRRRKREPRGKSRVDRARRRKPRKELARIPLQAPKAAK